MNIRYLLFTVMLFIKLIAFDTKEMSLNMGFILLCTVLVFGLLMV